LGGKTRKEGLRVFAQGKNKLDVKKGRPLELEGKRELIEINTTFVSRGASVEKAKNRLSLSSPTKKGKRTHTGGEGKSKARKGGKGRFTYRGRERGGRAGY